MAISFGGEQLSPNFEQYSNILICYYSVYQSLLSKTRENFFNIFELSSLQNVKTKFSWNRCTRNRNNSVCLLQHSWQNFTDFLRSFNNLILVCSWDKTKYLGFLAHCPTIIIVWVIPNNKYQWKIANFNSIFDFDINLLNDMEGNFS
jgi:hypothetical protein